MALGRGKTREWSSECTATGCFSSEWRKSVCTVKSSSSSLCNKVRATGFQQLFLGEEEEPADCCSSKEVFGDRLVSRGGVHLRPVIRLGRTIAENCAASPFLRKEFFCGVPLRSWLFSCWTKGAIFLDEEPTLVWTRREDMVSLCCIERLFCSSKHWE